MAAHLTNEQRQLVFHFVIVACRTRPLRGK